MPSYRPPIRLTGDALKRFQAGEVAAGRALPPLHSHWPAKKPPPRPVAPHPILRGRVAKRISPERRLRAQKKASAATSLIGGTAGLTGLALLAARRPKQAAAATTIGGGVGGIGAFNFASIQNQESKKRGPKQAVYVVRNKKQIKNIKTGLEPVAKGATMDFGLNDVRQGENIEKRFSAEGKRTKRLDRYASGSEVAGLGLAAGAGYGGVRAFQLKSAKGGALAGAAGLGAIGAHLGANRIRSYKTGKGSSYKPLARRVSD